MKKSGPVQRLVLGGFVNLMVKKIYRQAEKLMLEDLAGREGAPALVGELASGLPGEGQS